MRERDLRLPVATGAAADKAAGHEQKFNHRELVVPLTKDSDALLRQRPLSTR
ncbi:MAG: hypothetical protein JNK92_02895 [Dechloromonas sp.]|nr:hypothetical protein [Dechloromonas sp.]